MAKYIDAKALYEKLYDADAITIRGCEIFRGFPAADVAEVKYGKWIMKETMIRSPFAKNAYCSECLEETSRTYNFCPNCGAKMKG